MDSREKREASDKHLWIALARIRETFDEHGDCANADTALQLLRDKLFEIRPVTAQVDAGLLGASIAHFRRFLGHSDRVDAVIAWLGETGQFNKKDIERIRRIRLFEEKSDGSVVVREQPLPESMASLVTAIVALLTGGWVAWVWFAANGDLQLIANSYALGTVLGSVVCMALDKSFRFAKARQRVLAVAPRLLGGVSVGR
jgi:hypothetical protein